MQEVFTKLRSLQDILSKKFDIEKEINEIPKVLTTKQELLNRLKKSYIDKNSQREKAVERIKHLRFKLAEAEEQREQFEKQMDMIKTQREYEALDKEIKDATEKEQQYRKDILREEKELEELNFSLEREENMIKQQEVELDEEQQKIRHESLEKEELLTELETEEKDIVPGLDEEILFKFERIIRSKSGVGIVPVRDAICTGCHMQLPSQFVNEVRAGETIHFCPYCSRILFYDVSSEAITHEEETFFQDDDAGSLADLFEEDED